MKKTMIVLAAFALSLSCLPAQNRFYGIGASYIFQGYGYEGALGEEAMRTQSIGLNYTNFTGGFLGMYTAVDLGYVLAADHTIAGTSSSYRFNDLSLQIAINGFTGLGCKMEFGSMTALFGGGLGFDITMLLGDEYQEEYFGFSAIGMGPGLAATFSYSLSENFGFYVGVRATYELLETMHDLESETGDLRYKGGLSVVPSLGMMIRT